MHPATPEDPRPSRAVLIAVHLPDSDDVAFRSSVAEMHRLARTLGLTVVATIQQKRRRVHAGTVVGSGKLTELQALTGGGAAELATGQNSDSDGDSDSDSDGDGEAGNDTEDHEEPEEVQTSPQEDGEEAGGDIEADAQGESSDPGRQEGAERTRGHARASGAVSRGEREESAQRGAMGHAVSNDAIPSADATPPAETPVKLVLVDHDITPSQARNLEKATGAEVLDRTAVILEIFRRHARSRVAKAQVEIVRLQYLVPRLREAGKGRDRQRGGIGGKGAGESGIELDRRKIRDRIAELTRELGALAEEQGTQRARRRDMNRVALVGYTNAGKSTLMRALTGSEVYVADKLFATLDTTVRALSPETRPRLLVSDTVGFIDKLPHGLVASFKSTLDEALEAGLLVQVVDASDPGFARQLDVTTEVLAEIGAGDVPRIIVFNKMDRLGDPAAEASAKSALALRWPDAFSMSARRPDDVALLRQRLIAHFARDLVQGEVRVPYDRQQLRGEIFATCEVLGERYQEDAVIFDVRAHPAVLDRLRAVA